MVKVVEVVDEDKAGSIYAESSSSHGSSTDSLASISSSGSLDESTESFFDRLTALVDIVPPKTRASISSRVSQTTSWIKKSGKFAGNAVWIVTTSALLVGLPLALSLEDEAKIVAQEKEMMAQQQGQQVLTL